MEGREQHHLHDEPEVDAAETDDAATDTSRRRGRRVLVIVLVVWAVVMAGEIGYIIGRDRTGDRTATQTGAAAGEINVLQVVIASLHQRLALQAAGAADQPAAVETPTTTPAVIEIPLDSFDPLAGQGVASYSGTLALTTCDGFGDAAPCAPDNHLAFTIGRAADGSLTLSSALFENAPLTRAGNLLRAEGPVANPSFAVSCGGVVTSTFFDVQLAANLLKVTGGATAVASYTTTFTVSAPSSSVCAQNMQSTYAGSVVQG